MAERAWAAPPEPTTEAVQTDATAMAFATALDSLIALGCATKPRSLQVAVGSSEAGQRCDRRIAYKLHGVRPCNFRDPLRSLVGEEFHYALADLFSRLNAGSARWLVEQPVLYRGMPGTVDLYDRHTLTVIDWKTSTKAKVRQVRREGPPVHYKIQLQIYAAALRLLGEDPQRVALAYLPTDGELADLWVWLSPVDERMAVDALDRVERLAGIEPADAIAKPDRLCPWCAHYRPGSTDLATGCPGNSAERQGQ
jgi:PD-(D/E)XK nuclease superfamily